MQRESLSGFVWNSWTIVFINKPTKVSNLSLFSFIKFMNLKQVYVKFFEAFQRNVFKSHKNSKTFSNCVSHFMRTAKHFFPILWFFLYTFLHFFVVVLCCLGSSKIYVWSVKKRWVSIPFFFHLPRHYVSIEWKGVQVGFLQCT